MKKSTFLFSLLLIALFSLETKAQSHSVHGFLIDSSAAPLPGATVVLLQAEDSVLTKFAISNAIGQFEMKKVPAGKYILQVTFLGFGNFSEPVEVKTESGGLDAGYILLLPKDAFLDEVMVKAEHIPMRINKDTIEYNAAAFQTKPNAVVEDLLKKLPGVEVNKDGTIKAQGEEVQQVLVDGKAFFGKDPQVATKNLPADAVDKVQVFDKKSDMAEFSGIDDGQRDKTINLSLKEDKKKGYFGNVSGGFGTEDRYEAKLSLNRFDKKMQFSLVGMSNNNNQQGFSIGEYMNFMGGLQNMMHGGGGSMRLSIEIDGGGLPIGGSLGDGFVNSSAGGANFNLEIGKKTDLNMSYFYNRIRNSIESETLRQNFSGAGSYNSEETSDQLSRSSNHKLNMTLKHELDSFRRIIWDNSIGFNDGFSESISGSQITNANNLLENDGARTYRSDGNNLNFNSNLTFMQRFRKKGRAFSANLSFGLQDDNREAFLASLNQFYNTDGTLNFADSLSQRQDLLSDQFNYGSRLSYTEPLGKGKYLEFNYIIQDFQDETDKSVYDISHGSTPEEAYNDHLSNHYKRDYLYNRTGITFRLNRKKANFNMGLTLQHSRLKGEMFNGNPEIKANYVNVLPSLVYAYDFSTARSMEVSYSTSVQEPSVEQLQPMVDNSDPLNLYVGNPGLRPEYSHRLNLRFHSFSQFSMTSVFASLSGNYSTNKITNAVVIDSLFRKKTQPVNVDNDFRARSYVSFSTPLRFIKSTVNISNGLNYSRSLLFVNNRENTSNRLRTNFDISIENKNTDVLDVAIGANFSHNLTRYSEDDNMDQDFLNQVYYLEASVNFLKTWMVGSSFDYNIYGGDAFGSSEKIPLWKAFISKYLFKNQRGELKLSVTDLLDRNQGINRTSEFDYIQEQKVKSLGRFFMISFAYRLSGFGAKQSGLEIIDRRRQ